MSKSSKWLSWWFSQLAIIREHVKRATDKKLRESVKNEWNINKFHYWHFILIFWLYIKIFSSKNVVFSAICCAGILSILFKNLRHIQIDRITRGYFFTQPVIGQQVSQWIFSKVRKGNGLFPWNLILLQ